MRKSIAFIAALAVFGLLAGGASATKLTEQQVKNVCGSGLQTGGSGGTTASGCDKKCGSHMCTYNCCSGKGCGEQGCNGHVVAITTGGGKTKLPLPAATLREIKGITVTKKLDAGSNTLMKSNNTTLGKSNGSLSTKSNNLTTNSGSSLKSQDSTLMKR